jgi:hypothetical protein
MMKTYTIALLFSLLSIPVLSEAQLKLPSILSKNKATALTQEEAGQGIKEALSARCNNSCAEPE